MAKRIFSGVLGAISCCVGILALGGGLSGIRDLSRSDPTALVDTLGILFAFAVGAVALVEGGRLCKFAFTGTRTAQSPGMKSFVIGVGCFFPVFLFSLPLTMLWANHTWPGDGQSGLGAMFFSFCLGFGGVILYWLVALMKHAYRR